MLSLIEDPNALTTVHELLALGSDVMRTSMRQMTEKLSGQATRVIDLFKKCVARRRHASHAHRGPR